MQHLDDEAGVHRGSGRIDQLMTDHDVDLVVARRRGPARGGPPARLSPPRGAR